jgi:hypothetical protein
MGPGGLSSDRGPVDMDMEAVAVHLMAEDGQEGGQGAAGGGDVDAMRESGRLWEVMAALMPRLLWC